MANPWVDRRAANPLRSSTRAIPPLLAKTPWLFQADEALQGLRHLLAAAGSGRDHVGDGEGRVDAATRLQLLDRHAGRGQGLGLGDAFVTQWVDLGRHDERRRQALKSAAQW